jgi:hypothetical protein
MSIGITLPPGFIAVYGQGLSSSPIGVTNLTPAGEMRWGSVYQIWDGGATYIYGGDSVMYKEKDVFCQLAAPSPAGWTYTIIPARLVTKSDGVAP